MLLTTGNGVQGYSPHVFGRTDSPERPSCDGSSYPSWIAGFACVAVALTPKNMNVIRKFRAVDMSEASASLKTFEDPEHGLHTVIRSFPAGMDIGPDIWRFEDASDALNQFGVAVKSITSRGFIELGEP